MYNINMILGLSTATFFGKILTENSFEKIKELGIDFAEVFLTTFSEYEDDFTEKISNNLQGIEVFSVHSLNNHYEPELFNTVERTRNDALIWFDKVCRGGKRLGAKYYTFHGPSMLKVKNYKIDYQRIGNNLIELNNRAKKNDIEIAYENVSWAYFNKPEFYKEVSKITTIKTTIDLKQTMQSYRFHNNLVSGKLTLTQQQELQDYLYEFIDTVGNSLVNIHISDYDEDGKLCAPGKGIFNYKLLYQKLKDIDYNNALMIELYSGDYNTFDELQDSIDYLKNIFNK